MLIRMKVISKENKIDFTEFLKKGIVFYKFYKKLTNANVTVVKVNNGAKF